MRVRVLVTGVAALISLLLAATAAADDVTRLPGARSRPVLPETGQSGGWLSLLGTGLILLGVLFTAVTIRRARP